MKVYHSNIPHRTPKIKEQNDRATILHCENLFCLKVLSSQLSIL